MTNKRTNNPNLEEALAVVEEHLAGTDVCAMDFSEVVEQLSLFVESAEQAARIELVDGGRTLVQALELASYWNTEFPEESQLIEEFVGFAKEYLPVLQRVTNSSLDEKGEIDQYVKLAEENWSEYLELITDHQNDSNFWSADDDTADQFASENESDSIDVASSDVEMLLAAVSDGATPVNKAQDIPEADVQNSAKQNLVEDRELLEAYMDDALRCLGSMEQATLAIEAQPEEQEAVRQFCRELHTLKGASATVGLTALATYLHELESSLEGLFDDDALPIEVEPLFAAVDRVREEIGQLQPNKTPEDSPKQNSQSAAANISGDFTSFGNADDSSIRIRAAKLDRLMDMLAELVVLRNRRESHVAEFNSLNAELKNCSARLEYSDESNQFETSRGATPFLGGMTRSSKGTLGEVAKDIAAVSQGLQELQKPVSQDNAAISGFIRDFRQELMQLRRIPVSGLFHRLQRAARDAAKSENKRVQVKMKGEQTGLEQEIQERLFESLLHIVRNSVSHGVESESQRIKSGKDPVGTITLESYSNAQLLVIEVRDDGSGVDYDAVRKIAIEKGLLKAHQSPSDNEIAQLIFHPGFSTRRQASQLSGRGVGMDVVAKTIEQLHGRVEVDSNTGQGTTMRLLIPLRTGIEHVMVFRTDGQLFALPMQSVTAAKSSNANIGNLAKLSLSSAFSLSRNSQAGSEDVLILKRAHDRDEVEDADGHLALSVDELIGPEEVVVRGLPNLLKTHPLFCGVTLSGTGETVLLLNSEQVVDFCQHHGDEETNGQESLPPSGQNSDQKRALVVDDSLTARKVLAKILQKHDFATCEAGDGIEAIERLHREKFDIVLTDLDMPRLGGMELLADVQSGKYCDAPIVVVSGREEEAFRTKAMDFGANDFVTKPVSENSIVQLLENLELLALTPQG